LEVYALAGGIRCQQNLYFGVVFERLLRCHTLFAAHAAVDDDDSIFSSEESGNAVFKIIQGVTVLGEENKFLVHRRGRPRNRSNTVRYYRCGLTAGNGGGGEDLTQEDG
jgi:hypothetical protein